VKIPSRTPHFQIRSLSHVPFCLFTASSPVPGAYVSSQKVFVRSEYYDVEEAALSADEECKDVFIVTGQPGIGPRLSFPISRKI